MSLSTYKLECGRHVGQLYRRCMRPRAILLTMITMRKSICRFFFLSYVSMGLRLAAIRAAGAPQQRHGFAIVTPLAVVTDDADIKEDLPLHLHNKYAQVKKEIKPKVGKPGEPMHCRTNAIAELTNLD